MKVLQSTKIFRATWLMFVFSGVCISAFPSRADAQSDSELKSLKLVPKDADFLYGSFRLPEQWNRLSTGPVATSFMKLPSVVKILTQFKTEWKEREAVGSNIRVALENGNVQDALAFLRELTSSELFLFGDKNFSSMNLRIAKINDEMASLMASGLDDSEEQTQLIATKWIEGLKGMTIPTLVMGARCDDTDLALGKIDQLEVPVFALKQIPDAAPFLHSLNRIEDKRGDRLQWVISGSQIPWDVIPTNDDFDEEMRDTVKEALDPVTFTLTIGLFDGNFIVALSPTPEALLELGKGESILEHPDMKPVVDAMSKPLIGIAYSSDALADSTFTSTYKNFFSRNLAGASMQISSQLEEDSEIKDFLEDFSSDLAWMDEAIAKFVPKFQGALSLTFLTDDGWERHDHLRTKDVLLDTSSKLATLEHVGGDPLMMVATKLQDHPEYFQLIRKIVQKAKLRFDEAVEVDWSELNEDEDIQDRLQQAKQAVEMAWPFLVRVADAWEKKFLPSMSGEHAIILSAGNLAAEQWVKDMPPASEPLPLIELATVTGLKDKSLFQSGFEDLFGLCDEIVEMIRKQDPNAVPAGYSIPRPTQSTSAQGEKFGYPIPADCPVPKDMMPQMLFSGEFAVGTYSDKQAVALMTATPLKIGQGVIDPSANQANASYVSFGRLFQFASPWLRYAMSQSMENLNDSVLDPSMPEDFANYELTGNDVLAMFGVLGQIGDLSSSTTSNGSGGTVTRSVYRQAK